MPAGAPGSHLQDGIRPWRDAGGRAVRKRNHLRRGPVHAGDQRRKSQPKCWISESQRYQHQSQTIIEGLSHSCNYFFYTLGYRLGETRLYQYASEFGLTSKTGRRPARRAAKRRGLSDQPLRPRQGHGEADQDTAVPIIVFNSIKRHLRNQGASRNITYDDERLDRCVKRLMEHGREHLPE